MPPAPLSAPDPEPSWSDDEDSAAYLGELMAAAAAGEEELTGQDISGAGFGQDGTAQQLHPGPVLATLVHAATTDEKILATLSDDDLVGVITAARRIGSFAAATPGCQPANCPPTKSSPRGSTSTSGPGT